MYYVVDFLHCYEIDKSYRFAINSCSIIVNPWMFYSRVRSFSSVYHNLRRDSSIPGTEELLSAGISCIEKRPNEVYPRDSTTNVTNDRFSLHLERKDRVSQSFSSQSRTISDDPLSLTEFAMEFYQQDVRKLPGTEFVCYRVNPRYKY